MKVVILGSTFPLHDDDSQVPWLRETAKRLRGFGHEVTVLAPAFRGRKSHRIDGVPVKRFRYAPASWEMLTHDSGAPNKVSQSKWLKLLTIPYILSGLLATFWHLLKERPDVINVHWPFPHGLMAWFPARLTGTKIVSTCHGAELAIVRGSKPLSAVLRWLLRHTDEITCNSSHTRKQITDLAGEDLDIHVLPYGSTVPAYEARPSTLVSEGGAKLLLTCGRIIERKGLPYLIDALPKILSEQPVKLVITGEGDQKAAVQRLVAEKGLEEHVEFAGFVSNERLGELYRTADLYVHPSIHDRRGDTEGLGVVLVEALANKRPVVASGVGGIVDVIKDGETGVLVEEKNAAALAEAVNRLLADPEERRRLAEAGYAFARSHFDWDRIILALVKVFAAGKEELLLGEKVGAAKPSPSTQAA